MPRAPSHPFLAAAQRELAARFIWATTPSFADANHDPRLAVRSAPLVSARPGEVVNLRVKPSDPDGDTVTVRWWRWDEADSYAGAIELDQSAGTSTRFKVPADAKAIETIHIVAEATDNGTPALTRYARFVVTVKQ